MAVLQIRLRHRFFDSVLFIVPEFAPFVKPSFNGSSMIAPYVLLLRVTRNLQQLPCAGVFVRCSSPSSFKTAADYSKVGFSYFSRNSLAFTCKKSAIGSQVKSSELHSKPPVLGERCFHDLLHMIILVIYNNNFLPVRGVVRGGMRLIVPSGL